MMKRALFYNSFTDSDWMISQHAFEWIWFLFFCEFIFVGVAFPLSSMDTENWLKAIKRTVLSELCGICNSAAGREALKNIQPRCSRVRMNNQLLIQPATPEERNWLSFFYGSQYPRSSITIITSSSWQQLIITRFTNIILNFCVRFSRNWKLKWLKFWKLHHHLQRHLVKELRTSHWIWFSQTLSLLQPSASAVKDGRWMVDEMTIPMS